MLEKKIDKLFESYNETKRVVGSRLRRLTPQLKLKAKEAAKAIYYRQENQNANYRLLAKILGLSEDQVDINTVTAILGVSSYLES